MMDESTPLCTTVPTAVQVIAANRTGYHFARVIGIDGQTSGRGAVAGRVSEGAFLLGSALATISTSQSTVYNLLVRPVFETALCRGSTGCDVDIDVIGYGNLAGASLRLGDLAAEMGAGSADDVFDAPSVTVGEFLAASATVLDRQGTTTADAAAAELLAISTELTTVSSVSMGDFVDATLGMGTAANTYVDALTLMRIAASVANGTNAITVPAVSLGVPGVASIGIQLSAIEKPIVVIGPPSVSGTTTQAPITISVNLNLQVTPLVRVTGALSVTSAVASATGTLTTADCSDPPGINVDASAQAVNLTSSGTLQVRTAVPIANLGVNGTGVATADPTTNLRFDYPDDYGITQRTGNTALGLNGIAYGNPTVTLLGILPLPLPLSTIMNAVQGTLGTVDTAVVTPLLDALGLNIGSAGVMAMHPLECGHLRLFV
jgi:hypothetical protein